MSGGLRIIDKQLAKATARDGRLDFTRLKAAVAATYDDFLRDADRTDRSMALMIAENDRLTNDLEATIQALGMENAGYAPALENMSHGLCIFDACNRLVIANSQYRAIYGLPEELVRPGTAMSRIFRAVQGWETRRGGQDRDGARGVRLAPTPGASLRSERTLENGRIVEVISTRIKDGGIVAVHEDITEKRAALAHIEHLARHDGLTGLPNRALFREMLEWRLAGQRDDGAFAVHYIDLDRFKTVNDTFGHLTGDELLRQVARRLRGAIRDNDMIARLGGDEFALIQTGARDPAAAELVAQRVIEAIGNAFDIEGHRFHVGVSIGIGFAPSDGRDVDRLLKAADLALYRAKSEGRNTFRFFEKDMDAKLQERRSLEFELRAAIERDEFELHYQPVFDLEERRISGFEALLRWNNPTRGRLSPAIFVPLAEETGLIAPLGEWVLRRACAEAATWPRDLRVAVNVSAAQFKGSALPLVVAGALATSGLDPARLELEVTESVLLHDTERTLSALAQLKALGLSIAMDDFGTGFSSLGYLRRFPFDKIKIDRSFVGDADKDQSALSIIQAVVGLGRSFGMAIIAEGVETEAQLRAVHLEGCREVQGYLIGRPVPASMIADLLTARATAAA